MDTADAAGGKYPDSGERRDDHGGRDRRRAVQALRDHGAEIATAALAHVLRGGEIFQLRRIQADGDPAAEDGNRRRDCAGVTHRRLDGAGGVEIIGIGQPVRDERGFERDDRLAGA